MDNRLITSKFNQIAAEQLKQVDMNAYQNCQKLATPRLNDLSLLPIVFEEITKLYPKNPENSPFILAVIYYLYAPFKLHYREIRMRNGVREMLCQLMMWKHVEIVNYYADILISYYKGPRWAEKVNEMGNEIYELLKEFDE